MTSNFSTLCQSSILITGGTGSFGKTFVPMTLRKFNPQRLLIYSRDEMKQWEMSQQYIDDSRVEFLIGDVRDASRFARALDGIDYVVHAAATRIVPTAEYNPFECIKTNIIGAMNIIDTLMPMFQKLLLSTTKPATLLTSGATKLASDKLFVAANGHSRTHSTQFSGIRYGNVMGSRGSVIPFFLNKSKSGLLPITDPKMTRFMITLEQAVNLVWQSFDDMSGGEIYVKKIPSMNILDIANAVCDSSQHEIIGIRPGEKIHEQMIGIEDSPYTYEYPSFYKILPMIHNWHLDPKRISSGKLVPAGFSYVSNTNIDWMSVGDLRSWIQANYNKIGII